MAKKDGPKKEMGIGLEKTLDALRKQYGVGIVQRLGDNPDRRIAVDVISTRSLELDYALGVGGFPRGRIIELYGPESSGKTTLAIHVMSEAQKAGGEVAIVDAEHAFDEEYASNIGLDVSKVFVSQPDCGEDALEVVEALVRSGDMAVVVLDSVAALVPRSEIEGGMGDAQMGLQARLMSQAMRKLTSIVHKTNTCVIFTNQIRNKIGVMFGCFNYDTLLNFTDGRSIPIGKVVDERIQGNVWTLNDKTGEIESKPIIDWHDNGMIEKNTDFIHIQTESINGKGRFGFTCTTNHKVLTNSGWKEAKDINIDDCLISRYEETLNGTYGDFVAGMLVGDSHISVRHKNTASLRLQDNENPKYIEWKVDKLKPFIDFKERRHIFRGFRYDSVYTYEFAKIKKELKKRDPLYLLNRFSNLGFAIWMMDDGYLDLNNSHRRYRLSIKRLKSDNGKSLKLDEICSYLTDIGFNCSANYSDGCIQFTTEATDLIAESICKYVPESMQYKLPKEYRGRYEEFNLTNTPKIVTNSVKIREIRYASKRQMRNKRKFDISVQDNHNYMVGGKYNGVIAHNSPETTTGGNALKFYASIRLDIRKIETITVGEKAIGIKSRVKVIKNKVAPPFKKAEYEMFFDSGISLEAGVIELGSEYGVINKSGTWYSYGDERLGQGKSNVKTFLKSNPAMFNEIYEKVKAIAFAKPSNGVIVDDSTNKSVPENENTEKEDLEM